MNAIQRDRAYGRRLLSACAPMLSCTAATACEAAQALAWEGARNAQAAEFLRVVGETK